MKRRKMKSSGMNTVPICKFASTFGGIACSPVTSVVLNDAVRTSNLVMKESCRKKLEDVWINWVKMHDLHRIWQCAGREADAIKQGKIAAHKTDRLECNRLHGMFVVFSEY
jgi:hypothetical protein